MWTIEDIQPGTKFAVDGDLMHVEGVVASVPGSNEYSLVTVESGTIYTHNLSAEKTANQLAFWNAAKIDG